MTNSEQKLAKSYQTCFKNTQNNYFVKKLVIKNKNLHTVVAFFNVFNTRVLGNNFHPELVLGERSGTFINSAPGMFEVK